MKLTFKQLKQLCVDKYKRETETFDEEDQDQDFDSLINGLMKCKNIYSLLEYVGDLGWEEPEIFIIEATIGE